MRATRTLASLALCLVLVAGCGGSSQSADGGAPYEEWDPVFPACTPYEAPAVAAAPGTKLALSVYHFNVQYVPGGLKGWKTDPNFDMDNAQVEDAIVTEGLEPIVDMYLRHPTWGADLEMQGYMVEIMAARHPAVLDKLRTLLAAGQVQLASVHYSDQLFLAYPRADMELSFTRNDQALATGCVQAGRSVFTQEGQFGEGLIDLLAAKGRQYAALPKNLFGYLHPEATRAPLYTSRGMDVVLAGNGVDDGDVSIRWTFMDDGELAASAIVMGGSANPYFGKLYVADPAVVAAHEQEISDLEGQGYVVTSIEAAVKALRTVYPTPPELPPILDCDWQPADTTMLLRWMGDSGSFGETERDNEVLTTNVRAREKVHGAQALVAHAAAQGADTAVAERDLAYAVRHVLWAQVSDASGWNPIANEVAYGLGHAARAMELCDGIAADLMAQLGMTHVEVDLATGGVTALTTLPEEPTGDPVAAPPGGGVMITSNREYEVAYYQLEPDHYRVVIDFQTAPAGKGGSVTVQFSAEPTNVAYSPALIDDQVVTYPRTDFSADATLALPLANGLIGLGNLGGVGERWLIKDLRTVHVAAVLQPGAPAVEFHDNTFPGTETGQWVFELIDGPAETALARAQALNVTPKVRW